MNADARRRRRDQQAPRRHKREARTQEPNPTSASAKRAGLHPTTAADLAGGRRHYPHDGCGGCPTTNGRDLERWEAWHRPDPIQIIPGPFNVGAHVRIIGGFEDGITGTIVANEPKTRAELAAELPGFYPYDRPYRYRVRIDGDTETIGGLHPVNLVPAHIEP